MKTIKYPGIAVILIFSLLFYSCQDMLLGPDVKPLPPAIHTSRFAAVLDSMRYAFDLPALAASIIITNSIFDAQAVGSRRYGGPLNVTNNDKFHLGSNTKAFTAVLIGVLIDEGLLSYDARLKDLFPELVSTMKNGYKDVTILEILSHSAGFVREFSTTPTSGTLKERRYNLIARALNESPGLEKGKYFYSNLGFIIAGVIAEKVTNRSYEDLLIEKVLVPLGITSGGFGPMGTVGLEDQPLQHTIHNAVIIPDQSADIPSETAPAGKLHMSIGDWAKYILWVLNCEKGNYTLLRPETAKKLTSGIVKIGDYDYYGCGWEIVSNTTWGRIIAHSGSNGFNLSSAIIYVDRGFAVITATNIITMKANNSMSDIIDRINSFYINGN